ncbi:MAG: GNAT family N-acetyltransferase [Alphaproteobacteria bacterium]
MTLVIAETQDIATCLQLRRVVFIEEQGVTEADEVDGLDEGARHLLALWDGRPIGTARLMVAGDTGKIGRVCVLPQQRGRGVGAALIRAGVTAIRAVPGVLVVTLGAQVHALGFYQGLGFVAVGEDYQDAGIAHRDMVLTL